jgi:predicted dehydrogenase
MRGLLLMGFNRKVGYAVIGCGRIATSHLRAINQLLEYIDLIATVDVQEDRARKYSEDFGARKYYTSVQDVLEDKAVEAVDLCLPPSEHCPVAVQAMNAGRHVVVEKPMCLTVAEADQMIEAADRNSVILMCGQSRRFNDPLMAAREMMLEGKIGKLIHISVAAGGKSEKAAVAWWKNPAVTGPSNLVANWSSHYIDQVLWMASKRPLRVYAEGASYNDEFAGNDEFAVIIGFEDGLMCSYQHSYNASFADIGGVAYMGTEGTITLKGSEVRLNGERVEGVGTNVNNFAAEIKEFATAICENRQPMASGREIRPVIAVMEAIIRSAATHEVVEL